MPLRAEPLKDAVYAELVRSLFATVLPSCIMSAAFALAVLLISRALHDMTLVLIGGAGMLASLVRLTIALRHRREALEAPLPGGRARLLERRFALSYLAFAFCLGGFGAYVFLRSAPEAHMLTICLLVGYCAGVSAGAGLRPAIAIPAMMIAICPAIAIALLRYDALYAGMGTIAGAMLVGGVHSVFVRHRIACAEISKRLTFRSLSRRDGLTNLPNRLALRECCEERILAAPQDSFTALHYLDLDGFKPVNDQHGHPAGDALLRAVAGRLAGALRTGDIAARLGGDEFAIMQFGLRHSEEAQLLLDRIRALFRAPFKLADREIRVSASIGTTVTDRRDFDLEQLMSEADRALYAAKRRRKDGRGKQLRFRM